MAKQFRIAPSILSANFAKLGQEITDVITSGTDLVHFDVMDNHYVPNLTIGPLVCESIREISKNAGALIDVHLMVKPVDRIIPDFAKAGANIITFHPEASDHIDRSLAIHRDGFTHHVVVAIQTRDKYSSCTCACRVAIIVSARRTNLQNRRNSRMRYRAAIRPNGFF